MLIHLLRVLRGSDRQRVELFLSQSRGERRLDEVEWLRQRIIDSGCVDQAREYARQLSDAAYAQATSAFGDLPDSDARYFLLALPAYVLERDR